MALISSQVPLKKEHIIKTIFPSHPKLFALVLHRANQLINDQFAISLIQLPQKLNPNKENPTNQQPTGVFVVRNCVDYELAKGLIPRNKNDDTSQQDGLLLIILTLIYVNNKAITLDILYRHLSHLGLEKNQIYKNFLPSHATPTYILTSGQRIGTIEYLINQFVKDGILDKFKAGQTPNQEADTAYLYTCGPKGRVLFPEESIKEFVLEFYPDAEEALEERIRRDVDRMAGDLLPGGSNGKDD